MDYILNTMPNSKPTIIKDGYIWRLIFMNGSEKGFYVRTNKKVRKG